MKNLFLLGGLLFFISTLTATSNPQGYAATDSLGKNTCAIVENLSAVFIQTDLNNATYSVTETITILNKQGEGYGHFYTYGDKFRELKDFSGIIKNASGTVVKKIGKKDLTTSSISEHLSTDDYSIYYECKQPNYPYTVEYTYQEKWKNGILSYPAFAPMPGSMIAVEKASYRIELPIEMKLRYNSNFECNVKDETVGGKHIYTFSAENLKAIDREPLAPSFREIYPRVLAAPSDICYDSYCGNMSDWKNYGLWIGNLLAARDNLPADFINKLKELTKNAESDREKASILYSYLQNNYRYVSIQLGIGGFQPIDATSVVKSGFGDCKGLTNLMMSMLKAIDIPSDYCVISTKERNLLPSFPNFNQADHVILLLPLKNDSIWLECTSQTLPFGYIHDNIAGHNAIIITKDGGKMHRLPEYPDRGNKKESNLEINISEEGAVSGKMLFVEHLHQYRDNVQTMISRDREKEMDYINGNINMPKIQVSDIQVSENKTTLPSCTLSAKFEANNFINKTGTRLFAPICPLRKGNYNIFTSASRTQDIEIDNGYTEEDTITFHIPDSYTAESLPKDTSLKTPFGELTTKSTIDGGKIIYTQHIVIFSGKYSKEQYAEIKAFFSEANSIIKRKLVLKKI